MVATMKWSMKTSEAGDAAVLENSEYAGKYKPTRREIFLMEMDQVVEVAAVAD
jgi:hypothetical protein